MLKDKIVPVLIVLFISACSSVEKKETAAPARPAVPPEASTPKVKAIWVPIKRDASTYEEGHYLYQIEEGATWKN